MKTGISVHDAMTTKPVIAHFDDTIKYCAKKMRDNDVGSIVIVDKNIPVGIISEKDIVEKVVAKGLDPNKLKAKTIMVKNLITISPDKDLYEAIELMAKEEIRKLPVVQNKRFLGLITSKDILKIEPSLFDLISSKLEKLKEEERKPLRYIEGICDNCGSRGPLYKIKNMLLCTSCKEDF